MTNWKELCTELVAAWDSYGYADAGDATDRMTQAANEARFALAKPNLPPKNCWLNDEPEQCPSPCVFDDPSEVISDCVYAQKIKCKTDCRYYRITDRLSEAFAIVQEQLDQLAGDQELMIYRWPDGRWTIEYTNPSSHVQLGEVSGEYTSNGPTLEQAVCKLAALLPENNTSQTEDGGP